MATDASVAKSSRSEEIKCFIHFQAVDDDDLKPFTNNTWTRALSCADTWRHSDGEKAKIATEFLSLIDDYLSTTPCSSTDIPTSCPIPQQARFHRTCYQKFTDKRKLDQAERKRKKLEDEEKNIPVTEDSSYCHGSSEAPEQKKPRMELRSRESSASFRRSQHVLPVECIICQKAGMLDIKRKGKRFKEPLSNCEMVDGGLLLKQATNEQNTRILRLIQNQDCVSLEVKYHASCYLNFTRPLSRKGNQQQQDRQYTESFKKFFVDIVEEKLIKEEKAWELVTLKRKFVEVVAEVEQLDASGYKTYNLKRRLQNKYPSLRFAKPKNPSESYIVYSTKLSAESLFSDNRASVDGPSDAHQ